MLLAVAAMILLAYARVHCYPTVDDPWTCVMLQRVSEKATDTAQWAGHMHGSMLNNYY